MNPEIETTPGVKTSEFWAMVVGTLAMLGYAIFGVPKDDTERLATLIAQAGTALAAVLGNALIIWRYIKARETVKVEVVAAKATTQSNQSLSDAVAANPNVSIVSPTAGTTVVTTQTTTDSGAQRKLT